MPERKSRSSSGGDPVGKEQGRRLQDQVRKAYEEEERQQRKSGGMVGETIRGIRGYKRGGEVKKTGLAKLHKGERVLTAKTAKKVTPAKLRAATRKSSG